MCLTFANATAIRGHQDNPPPARGFTRTRHHAGYLSPGDLWRPGDDQRWPHTVMTVSNHHGTVVLTDQYGVSYRYSADAVIPTVVLDTWVIPGARLCIQKPETRPNNVEMRMTTPSQATT